jgi:hypothetical protein
MPVMMVVMMMMLVVVLHLILQMPKIAFLDTLINAEVVKPDAKIPTILCTSRGLYRKPGKLTTSITACLHSIDSALRNTLKC